MQKLGKGGSSVKKPKLPTASKTSPESPRQPFDTKGKSMWQISEDAKREEGLR
jgi:hypothetical protein